MCVPLTSCVRYHLCLLYNPQSDERSRDKDRKEDWNRDRGRYQSFTHQFYMYMYNVHVYVLSMFLMRALLCVVQCLKSLLRSVTPIHVYLYLFCPQY